MRVWQCHPQDGFVLFTLEGVQNRFGWYASTMGLRITLMYLLINRLKPQSAFPQVVTLLLSIFPMYTFIMATYDGALGALLLVTAVAFPVWIVERRGALHGLAAKQGFPQ